MLTKILKSATLAVLASQLVSAQTFSDCNPYEGDDCTPNPAFGDGTVTIDFTKGESDVFDLAAYTSVEYDSSLGAVFSISKDTEAPTMISKKYLLFGRVDAVIQAAPGVGIVSSFTLQSDTLDEIDWEWVGGSTDECQSNYFGKGDTSTYDRGAYHTVPGATTSFHTYSIEWTASSVQWIIDGSVVRTLNYADAQGGSRFPQSPMQVRLGTWTGGRKGNPEGTIKWAGGLANFDDGPFIGYYKSITITDYSNGVKGATEYVYTDHSGNYESIEVVTRNGKDDDKDIKSSTTSSTTKVTSSAMTKNTSSTSTSISTSTSESESDEDSSSSAVTTMTTTTSDSKDSTSTPSGDGEPVPVGGAALSLTSANAAFAACVFLGALVL